MIMKNNDVNVTFTQDNLLHYHKTRDVFPVEKTDWNRLRSMIAKYSKVSIVWWSIFSFSLSLMFSFILNYLLVDKTDTAKQTFLFGIITTAITSILSLVAAVSHRQAEEVKKNDLLEEMDRMEVPLEEEIIPEQAIAADNQGTEKLTSFKILKGIYGTSDKNVDVTDKLNGLITDGKLVTKADNALSGDPAPGTKKSLDIQYENIGETFSKKFEEGDHVSLPE